jgi:hypothetical protein
MPLISGKDKGDLFEIIVKVEMAEMATLFYHKGA